MKTLGWWDIKDSNLEPIGYEPSALTVAPMSQMAGDDGFEPPNVAFKVPCLTSWLIPFVGQKSLPTVANNLPLFYYIIFFCDCQDALKKAYTKISTSLQQDTNQPILKPKF